MHINLGHIPCDSIIGRILRFPFRLIPVGTILPVLQGPLRGMRWIIGSSNHGCWLGWYEYAKQRQFTHIVRPGHIVLDVGAHVGFYTLLASRLVGPTGRVIAFEPLPRNLEILHRHVKLNDCTNVIIHELAISDKDGTASFALGLTSYTGKLANQGQLSVKTRTLDSLRFDNTIPAPDVIKIDVEGAEKQVLIGAIHILRKDRPIIFLATHGEQEHNDCLELLNKLSYKVRPIPSSTPDELLAIPSNDLS